MFDIFFEKNKYFLITNNGRIIYKYPENFPLKEMDQRNRWCASLTFGWDIQYVCKSLLNITDKEPIIKSYHSINDDTVYFRILSQNPLIRGNFWIPINIGNKRSSFSIQSVSCPDIIATSIYLRGSDESKDHTSISKSTNYINASIIFKIIEDLNNNSIQQIFLDSLSDKYSNI
jgi:hypothetical protein